jgi:hypothetical protein
MRRWRVCMDRGLRLNAILLIGLLPWVEPAGAEEHQLTVSVHEAVRPTPSRKTIEKILERASQLLQRNDSSVRNDCDVTFKLKELKTFSSASANITDDKTLEAVHSVVADVKVVQTITYCKNEIRRSGFWGCAWRPEGRPKSVIVAYRAPFAAPPNLRHIVWAHEFGHTTGLEHRDPENTELLDPLMTACSIESFTVKINKYECGCFRAGPRSCQMPDQNLRCSSNSSKKPRRPQTD